MKHLALIITWLLLSASALLAQESNGAPVAPAYETALDRALNAHALGDYAAAEAAMREAHALSPNARTLRGLGVILYAQGRYIEAVGPLEAARTHPEKPLSEELRAGVDELLGRVWQRIGRLTLQIEPADSALTIDGAAALPHGEHEILLNSGEHLVRLSAAGRAPYELNLHTLPGSRDSLHVVLPPLPESGGALNVAVTPALESVAPGAPRRADRGGWSPLLRNSLFVASAAVVLTGAATWLTGYMRFSELKQQCEKDCGDRAEQKRRFGAERIAPLTSTGVALMATGAGALLVLGGVELWQRRTARTKVALSPWGAQLRHQF